MDEPESGSCTIAKLDTVMTYKTRMMDEYGISVTGRWAMEEIQAAYYGVQAVGSALSRFSSDTMRDLFTNVFGSLMFYMDPTLKGFYGHTDGSYIRFQPGTMSARLVAHELGHSFEQAMTQRDGGYSDTNPISLIQFPGIWSNSGKLITGLGYYHANMSAPYSGYYSDDMPDIFRPSNTPEADLVVEDWADMFMNWSFGTFYPNEAGRTLDQWVTTNMSDWIH